MRTKRGHLFAIAVGLLLMGCPHSIPSVPVDAVEVVEETTVVEDLQPEPEFIPSCIPDCWQRDCGWDGCWGSCGDCAGASECEAGICVAADLCGDACAGKECGDAGLFGCDCGTCSNGLECNASGQCVCVPDCGGKECGDDLCGGSCGSCDFGTCGGGSCLCTPDCEDKTCGPDGCGGSCGECPGVPCLAVAEAYDFGQLYVGSETTAALSVTSCSDTPLHITQLGLAADSAPAFDIPSSTLDHMPSAEDPVVLAPGETIHVDVNFAPASVGLHKGTIRIDSNSQPPVAEVLLTGGGMDQPCPVAKIGCAEGDEVIPQTILHLFGDDSTSPNGEIKEYEWDVSQPPGSQSVFVPSAHYPTPTFETNMVGVYTFYLTVVDQIGKVSCYPGQFEIVVIPDEAVHIEMYWYTPEDPDETDTGPEAGSDLDVHFLHPWAAGPDLDGDGAPDGWFDIPFDCFWFNAHPNWGSYDPGINDDPGLDRDDTDGAGPENINLDIPENVTYRIGVHYWNDHGYGSAYATVRIYVYANPAGEVADVQLVDSDMWFVGSLNWPDGVFTMATNESGDYHITPAYHNPYFFQ